MKTPIETIELIKKTLIEGTLPSICNISRYLVLIEEITFAEFIEFNQIFIKHPVPISYNTFKPYYFRKYDIPPRIDYLNQIITSLTLLPNENTNTTL